MWTQQRLHESLTSQVARHASHGVGTAHEGGSTAPLHLQDAAGPAVTITDKL